MALAGLTTNCGSNILVEDSFQSVQITPIGGGLNLIFGGIQGTINQTVANYFGLGNNTGFAAASFNFTITSAAAPGNAITDVNGSGGASGGVLNANATVPEDWNVSLSLAFLGFALAGLAFARRLGSLRVVAW
jgi:hypothetical protein